MLWRDKNEGISMRRLSREVGVFVTPSWGVTSGGLPNEGTMFSPAIFKSLKAQRFGLCFFLPNTFLHH